MLQAAGSNAGAAVLAALAGRQQSATEPEQGRRPRRGGEATADAAADEFEELEIGGSSDQQPATGFEAAGPGQQAAAASLSAPACPLSAPACPLLEHLDLSGCIAVKGSALRRAVRCLPGLLDLCLNDSGALHALLDLLPAVGKPGKSSGKVAAVQAALAQLTRLEALNADNLNAQHAAALLRQCPSLRRLALGSKQLAAEHFDRQQHWLRGTGDNGSGGTNGRFGGDSDSAPLPSLLHLEVGWGTGGTFLQHLLRPHLASLTAHVGAAVSDWDLRQLAASCRFLARLSLKGANVSDAGGTACCCCHTPVLGNSACRRFPRSLLAHLSHLLTCRRGGGAAALLAADLPSAAGLHRPLHRSTGSASRGRSSRAWCSSTGQQQQQQ